MWVWVTNCSAYAIIVVFTHLFIQSTTKAKLPISLNLNLCNVKVSNWINGDSDTTYHTLYSSLNL